MTDFISPDHLQTLTLGRIHYYSLHLKVFDHYSCDGYFPAFIKNC